jgi:anaerobic ribonucleoside-triphosphate reductase activating protein
VQGCPIRCKGCQNPQTWDPAGGKEFTPEVLDEIEQGILANGLKRTLCIMGGEPLCQDNIFLTTMVITEMLKRIPDLKIWVWTGYTYEEIKNNALNPKIQHVLDTVNGLVTGPYVESLRDITLPMRGSKNQEIIQLKD